MDMLKERFSLTQDLIASLISNLEDINSLKEKLYVLANELLTRVIEDNQKELSDTCSLFEENINRICSLNTEATKTINSWYEWKRDPKNTLNPLYPIIYNKKKKRISKKIASLNEEIVRKSIDNRLIKEKIASWEIKVKKLAQDKLKESSLYENYENLLLRKESLLNDLSYLLSTLPGICPVKINFESEESINQLLSKLHS